MEVTNINGYSELEKDWKENTDIIQQEKTSDVKPPGLYPETLQEREIKADILDQIIEEDTRSKDALVEELDHTRHMIEKCLNQLQEQGILEEIE